MTILFFLKPKWLEEPEGTGAGQGVSRKKRSGSFGGFTRDLRRFKLPLRRKRVEVIEKKLEQAKALKAKEVNKPPPEIFSNATQISLLGLSIQKLESLQAQLEPLILKLETRLEDERRLLEQLEADAYYIEQEALDLIKLKRRTEEEAFLAILLAAGDDD